ncbi:hypothetical protein HNY73_018754 [Argiope bruennichi]|uniref:Uncharacterized protein n=1 Tax=Argiope bruennichi TaxID=94029 RepID=A0A8T0EE85_ARGBR|nr:hypothetical protein HNY73_018754 [Argiope bruennichi]
MEGFPITTLEEMAISKIGTLLSSDTDINQFRNNSWRSDMKWKNLLKRKISDLLLPPHFHKRMIGMANRIYMFFEQINAIHDGIRPSFGGPCQCLDGVLQSYVFDTSDSMFDERKIIESLVVDERIDAAFRFILVSLYFLEDSRVPLLRHLLAQIPTPSDQLQNEENSRTLVVRIRKPSRFRRRRRH